MSGANRIDTHQHVVPKRYRDWLMGLGLSSGGKPVPEWSVDAALEVMSANGIGTSILSVSMPGVEPAATQADAARWARELNEEVAAIVSARPVQFGFFATVTLPDVDTAITEAVHALDHLGADGVIVLANSEGVYLGDPSLDPFLEELNAREAVVFVHPSQPPLEPVPGIPAHAADFLLDTTRAALNMARHQCLDRFPNLKVILSHGGGFVPFAAQRMAITASSGHGDEEGLRRLRQFHFDTALLGSPFALSSLTAFADPTRITYGSDFPFAPAARATQFTERFDAFDGIDHHAVNRGNAERLFPRLRNSAMVEAAAHRPPA